MLVGGLTQLLSLTHIRLSHDIHAGQNTTVLVGITYKQVLFNKRNLEEVYIMGTLILIKELNHKSVHPTSCKLTLHCYIYKCKIHVRADICIGIQTK